MDRKSKIVLVVGIILSVAGLVSLASALTGSWQTTPCRVFLTPPAGSSFTGVYMPLGCQATTEDVPTVQVPENVIERLGSVGGGY